MKTHLQHIRVDKLLADRGLAPSRERAQALILAGLVYTGTQRIQKPSESYPPDIPLEVRGEDHPYVSRGGVKLAGALDHFKLEVKDKICLDVGASTGGFTDCLLQRGAKKVYALDVGYGQLAWKLRQDPRVIVWERKNVKDLGSSEIPDSLELVVADVSFISLTQVVPVLMKILPPPFDLLALLKPQFEAGKGQVPKGGVIREESLRQRVVEEFIKKALSWGGELQGPVPSVLKGAEGNQEFFFLIRKC
jgi:23S rRNA (cytidine1920-2'-O)/16S rRNA (cytidine1409-2'-O)-methyltransferase